MAATSSALTVEKVRFDKSSATIIGAGATGSHVALTLARLGMRDIRVYDADVVEPHNTNSQVYGNSHVGMPKVLALAAIIKETLNIDIKTYNEFVDTAERLSTETIFCLTDTMKSREKIFKSLNPFAGPKYLIETRMAQDSCRIYSLDIAIPELSKRYAQTLYSDKEAAVSACGGREVSVSATAQVVAGLAVWQYINLMCGLQVDHEVLCFLNPMQITSMNWTPATGPVASAIG